MSLIQENETYRWGQRPFQDWIPEWDTFMCPVTHRIEKRQRTLCPLETGFYAQLSLRSKTLVNTFLAGVGTEGKERMREKRRSEEVGSYMLSFCVQPGEWLLSPRRCKVREREHRGLTSSSLPLKGSLRGREYTVFPDPNYLQFLKVPISLGFLLPFFISLLLFSLVFSLICF